METIKNIATIGHCGALVDGGDTTTDTAHIENKIDVLCRFSPAEALAAFDAEFLGEHLCRLWILGRLHQTHRPCCPGCGETVASHLLQSFWNNGRVRCGKCRKYFTALTGTFLSGCHMNFREIFLLSVLLALDLVDKHIAQILDISPENVRLWRLKFNGQKK